jgi:S1-C subfamily serine protease
MLLIGLCCLLQPSTSQADPESYADIVEKVMPSVVNISIESAGERVKIDDTGSTPSYATYAVELVGAGSIIDPSGIIATNKHVINNAYSITVTLQDGSAFPAQLLGKGVGNDLAMLKIDAGRPLPPVKVGNSDELRVGGRRKYRLGVCHPIQRCEAHIGADSSIWKAASRLAGRAPADDHPKDGSRDRQ